MDFSGYDLILTTNHRLSASLNLSIPVYSLSQWLEKAFLESQSTQTLLNSHQQLLLIKTLIAENSPEYLGLAALIQSAWHVCTQHRISIHDPLFNKNDDTQLFQSIALLIEDYYRRNNLTDLGQVMAKSVLPERTGLVGFTDLTPLEQKVLGHCERITLERSSQKISKALFPDSEMELKTMVLWASSQPKTIQTACVIPDLETHRDKLEYYFNTIIDDRKAYTMSAVKKFGDYYFIQDALSSLKPEATSLRPSEWAESFQRQLDNSGFPGTRPLNNEEFQLSEKLKDIFKTYKNYDFINKKLNYQEAFSELSSLCSRIPFQVTASKTANIHILSLLESKGLLFDKLWVAGMDNRNWPNKSRTNPFLPFPHTVSETRDFTKNADEIIFSYPQQNRDETLIPADILKDIAEVKINLIWPQPVVGAQFVAPVDENVPVDLNHLHHRGSQIFKDHIACPFRAFAKHRLNAQKEELPQMGFTALQRGNLVHQVLENFWKAVQSKQILITYPQDKLGDLIDSLINNSLNKFAKTTQEIFILAEKARLQKLMLDWIDLEKKREDFVVIATEQTLETHLGKLPLKLRIDRIDKIAENKYLIIDYKTSQYDIRGDYLDEPQLPLYAILSAVSVDNIAYAYLRTGNSKLKEIAVKDMKNLWEQELLKIADDFLSGNAKVQPKYGEETCRMCDLSSLCRIKSSPSAPLL
ncbi:MAG TPA: PD-(D/E)XK nuclease family protein [Gammaproteobacteria bacterium]|nr:PD-(D/E)XK nuclease family protein [Gammaproteobacteria bacterium]